MSATWAVDLYGFGAVGRALLPLLRRDRIGLRAVRGREGVRRRGRAFGRPVVVDATSPVYDGSEAELWVRRLEAGLAAGTPLVTCNKAPLAIAGDRLEDAARRGGTTIGCTGTVGGGTPVLPFLRRLARAHRIERIDASLSGTLSVVLDRLAAGEALAAAVEGAQRAGFAEPDPTLDLDGTDLYAKAVIVHNTVFAGRRRLRLTAGRPRLEIAEARIRALAEGRTSVRAVARIVPGRIRIGLAAIPRPPGEPGSFPTAEVDVRLEGGATVELRGPGAGPRPTAGALLSDLLELPAGARGGGPGRW